MRSTILAVAVASFGVVAGLPAAAQSSPVNVVASGHRSGQCLDYDVSNKRIVLWGCHGGWNQQFAFQNGSYGAIQVNGQCLTTTGGAGASLSLASCNNSKSQKWANTSEGWLRNEEGWCADVEGGGGQGSRVISWQCGKSGTLAQTNQRWAFTRFYSAQALRNMGTSGLAVLADAQSRPGATLNTRGALSSSGNIIAAGGGNIIAAGGGNVIAAGGGNVMAPVSGVIAAGGLN